MSSTVVASTDEPAFPDDAVEVGRILGAWGIQGSIRVQPFSADPRALYSSRRWFLQPPENSAPRVATASALPRVLPIATRPRPCRARALNVARASFPRPMATTSSTGST
jgi:hypothetical protein